MDRFVQKMLAKKTKDRHKNTNELQSEFRNIKPFKEDPAEYDRRMKAELGAGLYRQRVCGLHVHVSMPDPETCLRVFEGVMPQLPGLLAASANSP